MSERVGSTLPYTSGEVVVGEVVVCGCFVRQRPHTLLGSHNSQDASSLSSHPQLSTTTTTKVVISPLWWRLGIAQFGTNSSRESYMYFFGFESCSSL